MDRGAWWATVHGVAKSQDITECVCTKYVREVRIAFLESKIDRLKCLSPSSPSLLINTILREGWNGKVSIFLSLQPPCMKVGGVVTVISRESYYTYMVLSIGQLIIILLGCHLCPVQQKLHRFLADISEWVSLYRNILWSEISIFDTFIKHITPYPFWRESRFKQKGLK